MHINRTHLAILVAIISQAVSTVAVAQGSVDAERKKAHVVSRLYQATYGAVELCSPSKEASSSFSKAMDQFHFTYPELMSLIDASPYLPLAKDRFRNFLDNYQGKVSDEALVKECRAVANVLRQLVETPSGQAAVNEYVESLKK